MFKDIKAFSGFSVDNIDAAKKFYGETLGLDVKVSEMGHLEIQIGGGNFVIVYPKENHEPATFTILNFPVTDIDKAVDELKAKGVVFDINKEGMTKTDDKGIARGKAAGMGPDIAWFKDPAGNYLSVLSS